MLQTALARLAGDAESFAKAITAINRHLEAAERAIAEAQNNLPIIHELIRELRYRRN